MCNSPPPFFFSPFCNLFWGFGGGGCVELYKDTYGALLLECVQAPVPRGVDFTQELEIFKDLVRAHHHEICAFILEPLVQCAGGMHMYSAEFVREAVLDIFERDSILARNKRTESYIADKMRNLASFPQVANIRHKGMIFAFDLVGTKKPRSGLEFFKMALARGVILRPLGRTIHFMPPFVITHEEVNRVVKCMEEILESKNL